MLNMAMADTFYALTAARTAPAPTVQLTVPLAATPTAAQVHYLPKARALQLSFILRKFVQMAVISHPANAVTGFDKNTTAHNRTWFHLAATGR